MKTFISMIAVATLGFTSLPAAAQTGIGIGQGNAQSSSQSASGSQANNNIVFPSVPATTTANVNTRQSGSSTTRVESAPSLGGLAVGGGHPCAWTPGSGQISVIGGGLGGAQMTIDEACMLAVMAAAKGDARLHNAAIYIIASRDRVACEALRTQGLVAKCGTATENKTIKKGGATTASSKSPAPIKASYNKCAFEDGAIRLTVRAGEDKATAVAQCKAKLGY